MPKPELGPVKVGDRLFVIPATYNNRHRQEPAEAEVTKVGRVWADFVEVDGLRTWKLRLDSQDDGKDSNYRDRFLTPEQHAWEQRRSAVREYLWEQQVMPDSRSPWHTEERMLALANLMRAHDGLDPL